ncbi:cilia- and flagella-associated protein 299 isoform X1 [Biomphalaria pfeifferi]|uniref:Cilia- and flagella-associated protein 299 n=1 Tax=Biomphalaria pfeifferi TaxID=112525 RepID=A0AAD8BNH6_BIOPF|nr:cilia- and flagella-associated protein 299 isoform X1 [Biomphalaria pfeifferi]
MDGYTFRTPTGKGIHEYVDYEQYLSSLVTAADKFYTEDVAIAQKLIELGFKGPIDGFTEEEFNQMKLMYEKKKRVMPALLQTKLLLSGGRTYEDGLLRALQMREEGNRNGKNWSIFFLRMNNSKGQEVSAYIDYAHRLSTEDFGPIFDLNKPFLPHKSDLSFLNWETSDAVWNDSPNYQVLCLSLHGIVFRNKRDNKIVNPDPFGAPGDNSSRTNISTTMYLSAFVIDHYNRL